MSTARPSALPELQRLLVVGGGGREHALAWALGRCPDIETVWVSPGNGGSTRPLSMCGGAGSDDYSKMSTGRPAAASEPQAMSRLKSLSFPRA